MIDIIRSLYKKELTLEENIITIFEHFEREDLIKHTSDVVEEILGLANRYHLDETCAREMALCHDIGRLIPLDQMVIFCESRGFDVSNEEARVPGILHQKASAAIARDIFKLKDAKTLAGIMVHTTLNIGVNDYAKALFIADKLTWDDEENEIINEIRIASKESLDTAICIYLKDHHKSRHELAIYHPWTKQAFIEYC
jgi:HD superfamily phosphohydrolase YqeK